MEKQQMREKLAELLKEISYDQKLAWYDLWDMRDGAEDIADLLIANGVTVQDEPIKMVIPEGVDEKRLKEMLRNAPLQIFPCEPVQEWIPVEDRLPEPFVSVLAYVPSEAPLPLVHESYIAGEPQLWVCILERRPWKDGAVTHWMPMPEPPKGE